MGKWEDSMNVSIADLERNLSKPRLQAYRNVTTSDTDAICLYIRNMELSYALYPVLQSVEVALRNSLHDAGIQHFGGADWFRNSAVFRLERRERRMLNSATNSIWERQGHNIRDIQQGTVQPPPPPIDDHITELMFGFWTGLVNAPYQLIIWNTQPGGIDFSQTAFRHAGRANRQRAVIFPIVNRLRHLRNRISHHEPIFAWRPALDVEHRNAMQLLSWISPSIHAITTMTDPFPALHQRLQTHHAPNITVVP